MNPTIALLFTTRSLRLFAYGALSVVLALYLSANGLNATWIGVIFTLTLAGDAGISLFLTTHADRFGRKKTLVIGAGLMAGAGLVFLLTGDPVLLVVAAIIGVISPSGNEIGPFLSVEQAMLSQLVKASERTKVFAWYNLSGSFATALGALGGGVLAKILQDHGLSALDSYRAVLLAYAVIGLALGILFCFLSTDGEVPVSEVPPAAANRFGLHESKGIVARLSALFALDAFAGGFVLQSFMAFWFHRQFGVDEAVLGGIFAVANVLAGVSALLAVPIARKIGLIRTMVFTHLPSNVLLILVPLMPNLELAALMLFLRFSISQMDVPTRQAYTMAVVKPDERSAATGITGIARSVGAAISPTLAGAVVIAVAGAPFFIAGGLKIVYDLLLYRSFLKSKVPDEMKSD